MDNRKLDKAKQDANLNEILNDDSPIPEDVDPSDHGDDEEAANEDDTDGEEDENDNSEEDAENQEGGSTTPEDNEEDKTPASEEEKDGIDYKQKFSASSREATALHFKNKKIVETIEDANNVPEPSEEELKVYARQKGAEYDELDDFAKAILKDTYINSKKFEIVHGIVTVTKDLDAWADKIDAFTSATETTAKYPSVVDQEDEFKKYAMKESRRGMDMDDLVASFLYMKQGDDPRPKPKKAKLLKGGSGGGLKTPTPKALSADTARAIRNKDPRRYNRLVKEGKIGLELLDAD